jgi:hypothetical protein
MKSPIFRDIMLRSHQREFQRTFRRNTSPPSSGSKNKPIKKQLLFATYFMLVSFLDYSSSLKTEMTCSLETSVDFQQTTWRYIQEIGLHNHHCENRRSYTDIR